MNRLAGFLEAARRRIAAGHYHTDGEALAAPRTFTSALDDHHAVIAELKPRTPSQGLLYQGDPRRVLEDYLAGGASGLSVLVDADFFDGSVENLRLAHATGLPVLFKDFVVDAVQLDCAKHHGCAAVLLIERVLEPAEREALVTKAHALGLQVVLEIHDEHEWATAKESAAEVIGINARDLDTLRLDREKQIALVETISASRRVLSLSGVRQRSDRVAAQAAGAHGVLVGTTLMQQTQRRMALMSLRHPIVKVCGLTRMDDVRHALDAGADALGLIVLSPDSPRNLEIPDAIKLADEIARHGRDAVLVTRCLDGDAIVAAATAVRPRFVQVHGELPGVRDRLREIRCGLWSAGGPGQEPPLDVDGFVMDSEADGRTGGTGATHDWQQAHQLVAGHPHQISFIAGGLSADNVAEALATTRAWGCDASSGLESAPGVKDPAKVTAYVQAALA